MAILILTPNRDSSTLRKTLAGLLNDEAIYEPDSHFDDAEITTIVSWLHPRGCFSRFPNLKLIHSLGAGADQIVSDPSLPEGVSVCRTVSPTLMQQMGDYVSACVYGITHHFQAYHNDQTQRRWNPRPNLVRGQVNIGILGLGALGSYVGQRLARQQFTVSGLSRSPKEVDGVTNYVVDQRDRFLSRTNILVNLLPLTEATESILNYELLAKLQSPAFLLHAGRGEHLVEAELLQALSDEVLDGAYLDVFKQEPLPPDHPFWRHPKISVTPHIASITPPTEAGELIAENIIRMQQGRPLRYQVDLKAGY